LGGGATPNGSAAAVLTGCTHCQRAESLGLSRSLQINSLRHNSPMPATIYQTRQTKKPSSGPKLVETLTVSADGLAGRCIWN
jgi:hypothetical protein